MLKGAIFDFDGTLFDSMYIWESAGERYLRSIGKEPHEDLQKTLKSMDLRQSAVYIKDNYSISMSVEEIMEGVKRLVEGDYYYNIQPRNGVKDFLEQLKEHGVKMCIATATDRYQVDAALKRCGMDGYFSEVFSCDEVGHAKDEPVIFELAMKYMKTTRDDTVVIEDAFHAAKTAKKAGFLTSSVYEPHENRQEELKAVSDCYLESFAQTDIFWQFAGGL